MRQHESLPNYRWIIVIASALILALAMGSIVNGMSAFIVPMQNEFGWGRGEISLINVSGLIGLAIGGLLMGPQADKRGTRPVVLFGVSTIGICYFLTSFASSLWHYYLLMFAAGFFGAAAIFSPIMALVGNWFPIGAGLAIGIASAGQALGQGGMPFLSTFLINNFGIDGAYALTGGAMLLLMIPLALMLKPPSGDLKTLVAAQTVSSANYLPERIVIPTMCLAVLLCCTCMSVPLMHLVPLIQDHGVPLEQAGSVLFLMLMVGILGRISFGKLADIISPLPAYMTATAWMAVLIYGFTQMESLGGFRLYAVIYGFGYAGVMTGVLVSTASLVRPERRGAAIGIISLFGWLGHANGGYLGGMLYDLAGTYQYSYGLAAAAGFLNLILVGWLYRQTQGPDNLVTA